tara:strand:+ start:257 stop:394 length:138 start_codon:yes stop_codon:yes gene_type:complete
MEWIENTIRNRERQACLQPAIKDFRFDEIQQQRVSLTLFAALFTK